MRFMMLVRSTKEREAGLMPDDGTFAAMARYNDELAKAGVLLAAEASIPAQMARASSSQGTGGLLSTGRSPKPRN